MNKDKKKLNKKEYAYKVIRERILDGTYSPGHRVIISQVAEELEVSAIPVREAVMQLEAENLIEYKPYTGAIVTAIDETQYLETLSVLAVLAGYATALSSRQIPDEAIARLEKINVDLANALAEFDFIRFGQLNRQFHQITYEYCGNQFLRESIEEVQHKLDTIRKPGTAFIPIRAKESIEEHEKIITLLKRRAVFEEIEQFTKQHKLNTVAAFKKRKQKDIPMPSIN